jgi:hypothetical protein
VVLPWYYSYVRKVCRYARQPVVLCDAPVVLQWCHSGVTMVLQWCHRDITVMSLVFRRTVVSQWCYSGVTVVSQRYNRGRVTPSRPAAVRMSRDSVGKGTPPPGQTSPERGGKVLVMVSHSCE